MVMFEKFTDRKLKEIIVRSGTGHQWRDEKVHFFLEENITKRFANKTVVPLTIFLNYKVR